MMHYKKGKNVEEELSQEQIPIEVLPANFLWMHVKGGSDVKNLVDYAKKALEEGTHQSVVWSGSDGGVGKTISCAEIMKRHFELHQVTRICYRKCVSSPRVMFDFTKRIFIWTLLALFVSEWKSFGTHSRKGWSKS